MDERKILYAEDGMILTNGTDYGRIIYLADGADETAFHPITEEEYEAIMNDEQAEAGDYIESLERLGVR